MSKLSDFVDRNFEWFFLAGVFVVVSVIIAAITTAINYEESEWEDYAIEHACEPVNVTAANRELFVCADEEYFVVQSKRDWE